MTFEAFKRKVGSLAKKNKKGHLCPNADTLYRLWEQKMTPEQVVELHCTPEAQKIRFMTQE